MFFFIHTGLKSFSPFVHRIVHKTSVSDTDGNRWRGHSDTAHICYRNLVTIFCAFGLSSFIAFTTNIELHYATQPWNVSTSQWQLSCWTQPGHRRA